MAVITSIVTMMTIAVNVTTVRKEIATEFPIEVAAVAALPKKNFLARAFPSANTSVFAKSGLLSQRKSAINAAVVAVVAAAGKNLPIPIIAALTGGVHSAIFPL